MLQELARSPQSSRSSRAPERIAGHGRSVPSVGRPRAARHRGRQSSADHSPV